MKISTTAILFAVVGIMPTQQLLAQVVQPTLVNSNFETYDDLQDAAAPDAASPSDKPAPADAVVFGSDDGCGCNSGCDCECEDACGPDPWRLFSGLNSGCHGYSLTGWLAGGATANFQSPADGYNGVQTFNDRNDIQLNQWYMAAQREVDGDRGFDVGGRIDLLYGSDHRFTMARGLETNHGDNSNKWNPDPALGGDGRFYGLAMPQMYMDVAVGGMNVRMGHFYTIIGYEVVQAPGNFFYSHTYTHQYGEPFTHTGMLLSGNLTDQVELTGGFHRGWDNWEPYGNKDTLSYLGGVTWTSSDESTSIAFALTTGLEAADQANGANGVYGNRTMYSFVVSTELPNGVQYVFQHDYGHQEQGLTGAAGSPDAEWYGISQYMIYAINDQVSFGTRFEWFRDDDGTRVAGLGAGNRAGGGFTGDFWGYTFGFNLTPTDNITLRPELRFDVFDGPLGQLPYDAGESSYQTTAGLDAIILW